LKVLINPIHHGVSAQKKTKKQKGKIDGEDDDRKRGRLEVVVMKRK